MVDATLKYLPKNFFEREAADAREKLRAMAIEAGLPELGTTFAAPCGAIHRLVLEEAKTFGADLIIIGSRRPSVSTYFLGSSASAILRHATCSVLVRRGEEVEPSRAAPSRPTLQRSPVKLPVAWRRRSDLGRTPG